MPNEATAYHEAGHAVVAFHLGKCIRRVTIVGGDDAAGMCYHYRSKIRHDTDNSTRARLDAEKRAMINMAGILTQHTFSPTSVRSHHGSWDFKNAIAIMSHHAGDDSLEVYLRLLEIWTRNIITTRWPQIEAVANELLKWSTLTGKEAWAIYHNQL